MRQSFDLCRRLVTRADMDPWLQSLIALAEVL